MQEKWTLSVAHRAVRQKNFKEEKGGESLGSASRGTRVARRAYKCNEEWRRKR